MENLEACMLQGVAMSSTTIGPSCNLYLFAIEGCATTPSKKFSTIYTSEKHLKHRYGETTY